MSTMNSSLEEDSAKLDELLGRVEADLKKTAADAPQRIEHELRINESAHPGAIVLPPLPAGSVITLTITVGPPPPPPAAPAAPVAPAQPQGPRVRAMMGTGRR
ncbi:MAG TPA: hypothetical protein VEA41_07975 [Salinarimonas sp.]|nr:hypothetical protein [Salinarimonas sp.]